MYPVVCLPPKHRVPHNKVWGECAGSRGGLPGAPVLQEDILQPEKLTMEYQENGTLWRLTIVPDGLKFRCVWNSLDPVTRESIGIPGINGMRSMLIDPGTPTDIPPIVEVLLAMAF